MAKKSKRAKYQKQVELVARFAEVRRQLKANGDYEALRKLPKDSHPNRLRNRDQLDGRPHAYMRKFGMSRINFRQHAYLGLLPGIKKASW